MENIIYILIISTFSVVSAGIVKRQACADKIQNCGSYGSDVCTSYKQWAQDNCAEYCHFCSGGSPQTGSTCVDKLPNCDALGNDLCSSYVEFAQINCAKKCDLCSRQSSGSSSSSSCKDKLQNCASYGSSSCTGQYAQWAKQNCQKTCGLCSGDGSFTGQSDVCIYKGQSHSEGESWKDGCDKNCTCVSAQTGYYLCQSICPRYKDLPAGCKMVKPPGECCSKPQCPSDNACAYKGGTYQQGQTWTDGCEYRCTCKNGQTGYYECTSRCVNWNLLPSCHLAQPAPGKCCTTPVCPPNVKINYPAGYVPE